MTTIVPAILPTSLSDLDSRLKAIIGVTKSVQLDVVDGSAGQSCSWPYTKGGWKEFEEITSKVQKLPHKESFEFEVDLMVSRSVRDADLWIEAGVSRVTLHSEGPDAYDALLRLQSNRRGENPIVVGIAVPCSASLEVVGGIKGLLDYVQVMGIAHIGKQGEPFDDQARRLVSDLHTAFPNLSIQVDGGLRRDNILSLASAGAGRLISGSAIFAGGDPRTNLNALQEYATSSQRA